MKGSTKHSWLYSECVKSYRVVGEFGRNFNHPIDLANWIAITPEVLSGAIVCLVGWKLEIPFSSNDASIPDKASFISVITLVSSFILEYLHRPSEPSLMNKETKVIWEMTQTDLCGLMRILIRKGNPKEGLAYSWGSPKCCRALDHQIYILL